MEFVVSKHKTSICAILDRLGNPKWYNQHGERWKEGMLFAGKPGCGKSKLAVAIALKTRRHLIDIRWELIRTVEEMQTLLNVSRIGDIWFRNDQKQYLFEEFTYKAFDSSLGLPVHGVGSCDSSNEDEDDDEKVKNQKPKGDDDDDVILPDGSILKIPSSFQQTSGGMITGQTYGGSQKIPPRNRVDNKEKTTAKTKKKQSLDFNVLLSLLDGPKNYNGMLFIGTTNEMIHDERLTRDGRLKLYQFDLPTPQEIQDLILIHTRKKASLFDIENWIKAREKNGKPVSFASVIQLVKEMPHEKDEKVVVDEKYFFNPEQ
jgi:hypothetical protein